MVAYIHNKYVESDCVEMKVRGCANDGGGTVGMENVDGSIGMGKDGGTEEGEVSWQRMPRPYG